MGSKFICLCTIMAARSPFANAPVSQFWVLGVSAASILAWSFHWKDRVVLDRYGVFNWAIWRNASSPFFATTATELLMGVLLLQQMRVIERRMGSQKYAGLTFLAASLASVLQFSTIALFPGKNFVFSGPAAVIFASLVQYANIVPAVSSFRFLGISMNEKWFTYLMASSLLLMQSGSSALTCGFGALVGILFRARGTGLSRFAFPSAVQKAAISMFKPILSISDQTAGPRITVSTTDAQAPSNRQNGPDLFANRNVEPIPQHLLDQVQPSEPNIATLVEMGFSRERAMRALSESGDSVDLAITVLTSGDD